MQKRRNHLIGLLIGLLCLLLFTLGLKSCDSKVKLPSFDSSIPSGAVVNQNAKKVDDLISAIATPITLDSADAIAKARAAYDALSDADKSHVKLLDKLKGFELDLSKLSGGDLIANNAADLDNLLGGLKLPLDAQGIDLLGKIRAAFDGLNADEKAKFKGLNLLEGLELSLKGGSELDNLLSGIKTPISLADADLLAKIRAAYDALPDAEKANFKGLDLLKGFELDLSNLLNGTGPEAVENMIKGISLPITLNSEADLNKALAAFNALSETDKAKVTNYNLLNDYLTQLQNLKNSSGAGLPKTGVE